MKKQAYYCDVCGDPAPFIVRVLERKDSGAGQPKTTHSTDRCEGHKWTYLGSLND